MVNFDSPEYVPRSDIPVHQTIARHEAEIDLPFPSGDLAVSARILDKDLQNTLGIENINDSDLDRPVTLGSAALKRIAEVDKVYEAGNAVNALGEPVSRV